jgi:hypothetical protein
MSACMHDDMGPLEAFSSTKYLLTKLLRECQVTWVSFLSFLSPLEASDLNHIASLSPSSLSLLSLSPLSLLSLSSLSLSSLSLALPLARAHRCTYTSALEVTWVLNYESSALNQRLLKANIDADVCGGGPCADFSVLVCFGLYFQVCDYTLQMTHTKMLSKMLSNKS